MGNKDSKPAKEGDKTEADKENEDLLEAVASLPKVVPLKSVKRPKGPKGRKPPSRNFLQAIVSYFQVKPQTTSHNSKEVEIVTKEPEVILDLNVVEKAAVLENVTKGRPAPPGNRRRPARVRNTKPRETIEVEVEKKAIDVESIESENTNIKKETKVFLKPPNRTQSKWKAIGIITVPIDHAKSPQEMKENDKEQKKDEKPKEEQNNNLEESIPKSISSEDMSQPPGKPPRPSLERNEKKSASNTFVPESGNSVETMKTEEKRQKPELPKLDKPKSKAEDINLEDSDSNIMIPSKNDFMKDLNMRLKIQPQPLGVKNKSSLEDLVEKSESFPIEDETVSTQISITVTQTEVVDQVALSSDKENINDKSSISGKPKKKEKTKKKGLFHKMKKLNLEATKKINKSFSKSFERKSTESLKSPITPPLEESQKVSKRKEEETIPVRRISVPKINPLYTEDIGSEIKEDVCEIEPPNPKLYMKTTMKPNMLEELNMKLNKNKVPTGIKSPDENSVTGKSPSPKPLLPQSSKPNTNEKRILSQPEPHSPVILKAIKRVPKDKRATSKPLSCESLIKLDERKLDAEISSSNQHTNTYNRSRTVNEQGTQCKEKDEVMIEKKLSLPVNVRKKSAQSIALGDAFNILDFELNSDPKSLENIKEKEDDIETEPRKEKVPRGIRKRSVQSVALDNAFNILNFELEPLETLVDEEAEPERVTDVEDTPIVIHDADDLSQEEKSVQSIELDDSLSALVNELDDLATEEEEEEVEKISNFDDKIDKNPSNETENESKEKQDISEFIGETIKDQTKKQHKQRFNVSEQNSREKHDLSEENLNQGSIDETIEEKLKEQNQEQISLSASEPKLDEPKPDAL